MSDEELRKKYSKNTKDYILDRFFEQRTNYQCERQKIDNALKALRKEIEETSHALLNCQEKERTSTSFVSISEETISLRSKLSGLCRAEVIMCAVLK